MLESVITFLIYLCLLALAIYLVVWIVRDVLGIPIPETVLKILYVIVALVAILFLVRMLLPAGRLRLGWLLDALPFVT
jgi:uncharacterized membrane protein